MFEGREPPRDDAPPDVNDGMRVRGKDMWTPGENLPAWWDVTKLNDIVVEDTRGAGNHDGETRIYSLEKGLVYIIDR